MAKAVSVGFLFIVMIGVTTTMPSTLVMATGDCSCSPPKTPRAPGTGSSPSAPGTGSSPPPKTPRDTGTGSSHSAGGGGSSSSCPLDALKLGACVDLLGGLVHLGIGDPVVNQCCPLLKGVLELEAALCLCTTIRLKLLNVNVILPLALELFQQCGLTPPPGFNCPPLN